MISAYDDPNPELLREYLRFTYASRVSHLKELVDQAKQQAGPNLIAAGNAYQFGPMYQPILPLLDLIVSEIPMGTLPEGKHAGLYLLARAIVGSKPVTGFPDIYTLANLSPQDYGLWRHWLAEALSCGATIVIPYEAFTMGGGSFTLPAHEIAPYTRFLREYPDVYTRNAKSPATVAVLYDLGSTLFDSNAWQSYLDLTKTLQEQHIPYDVLFLGDGELITTAPSLEDLERYSAVIIPAFHRCTTLGETLSVYTARGGNLVRLDTGTAGSVGSRLRAIGVNPGIETDAPPSIGIFPYVTREGMVVHLVNYAYDYSQHDFQVATGISLKITLPEGTDSSGLTVKLLTPDGEDLGSGVTLPWERHGDSISFTVPEVRCYAVVTATS